MPEQWVSYTYESDGQPVPTLTMTPDGSGFHATASVVTGFAGVGLSFLSDDCIDGTDLTGIRFDFDGDLAGRRLNVGVLAEDNVSTMYDGRGTCTGGRTMCFGPMSSISPTIGTNSVPFQSLTTGMPVPTLSTQRIINVQWELGAAQIADADFTISNVQFYK
jgi:hypothetical protein